MFYANAWSSFFIFIFRNVYRQNTNATDDECHRVSDDLICDPANQIQHISPLCPVPWRFFFCSLSSSFFPAFLSSLVLSSFHLSHLTFSPSFAFSTLADHSSASSLSLPVLHPDLSHPHLSPTQPHQPTNQPTNRP